MSTGFVQHEYLVPAAPRVRVLGGLAIDRGQLRNSPSAGGLVVTPKSPTEWLAGRERGRAAVRRTARTLGGVAAGSMAIVNAVVVLFPVTR